ncbi:nicotinate phosphoribosyltransferase [Marinobacteraceae bacterium S3BR75-40.1]
MARDALTVHESDLPLLVDLYEMAMAQAYWSEGMNQRATFSLFFRRKPNHRNFLLACGQQHITRVIQSLRFSGEHLKRLSQLDMFDPAFLDWLAEFRFSGDVHALPEGTPVFPQEPLLEVEAPIIEAQILESLIMNYVHLESVIASKAVRLVEAAQGRPVVDFGMRRMHGLDAAYRGVRAYATAGLAGTSNILAGQDFDLPVKGTMAHSFVQAHDDEMAAFKAYARLYPGTTLLVDTYDTERAVRGIVDWLKQDDEANIGAIRLDSGDLAELARRCRKILDDAGLKGIKIMASSGLDEYKIQKLVRDQAPIDGFGVGTALGAAEDAPSLELAYKLTEYAGEPSMKSSTGKQSFPGRKQVFRQCDRNGRYSGDLITLRGGDAPGEALLVPTMEQGEVLEHMIPDVKTARDNARDAIARLPDQVRALEENDAYPVTIGEELKGLQTETLQHLNLEI